MKINPNANIDIQYIGDEATPVVIIDDVLTDCSRVIDTAISNTNFAMINTTLYPGVRAILPKEYVMQVLRALAAPMSKVYAVSKDKHLKVLGAYYSLVSIPPSELHQLQKKPHFDSSDPQYFAMVHYLNPKSHGGTGFFRHKPTGYEQISKARKDNYLKLLQQNAHSNTHVHSGYMKQSNSDYELIYAVDYKPNRLVFYPGSILHSGLINEETDIGADPAHGRLTANMFICFE